MFFFYKACTRPPPVLTNVKKITVIFFKGLLNVDREVSRVLSFFHRTYTYIFNFMALNTLSISCKHFTGSWSSEHFSITAYIAWMQNFLISSGKRTLHAINIDPKQDNRINNNTHHLDRTVVVVDMTALQSLTRDS